MVIPPNVGADRFGEVIDKLVADSKRIPPEPVRAAVTAIPTGYVAENAVRTSSTLSQVFVELGSGRRISTIVTEFSNHGFDGHDDFQTSSSSSFFQSG